jgi:branched-chain amino acid transport system permease protein
MNTDFLVNNLADLTLGGLAQGAIYALVALGYTLVYGVLRLINFAHSEVFVTGTFATVLALRLVGLGPDDPIPALAVVLTALLLAVVLAALASGAVALVVERVAYRPLRRRNAPPLVFLISAIGASLLIQEVYALFLGRDTVRVGNLVAPSTQFTLFGADVTNRHLLIITSAVIMMVCLDTFVSRTRLGRGLRAVSQNAEVASLMGVNRDRVIALAFLLGGLMAGVAAVLYDLNFGVTRFSAGFLIGLKAFTAAVLGGIGNLRGALLGGLLLGLMENWGQALLGSAWRDVIAFVFLIVVLMIRPTGILGESLGRARV